MTRLLCVGECMVELHHVDATTLRSAFGGDTYNTAVYVRRVADELGVPVEVGYLTGVGDDDYSTAMRTAWAREGVVDRSVVVPDRQPGVYTIRVDERGERRFSYWRNESAARALLARSDWLSELDADLVYLSGITLQLLPNPVLEALIARLDMLRAQGVRIAFDTNYRPAGWLSGQAAAAAIEAVAARANIVLTTDDDEELLHGSTLPCDVAHRVAGLGPDEVVVKVGGDGAWVATGGATTHVPPAVPERVVDTTAAGDSFAGGYLAARLHGRSPVEAAHLAAQVAAVVISHPGAITPRGKALTRSGIT